MTDGRFESASGLRPVAAFVLLSVVLLGVGARSLTMTVVAEHRLPKRTHVEPSHVPTFDLDDRNGDSLATFVERLDLCASPQALWRAHTPERIVGLVAECTGRPYDEVLADLMPDAVDGVIYTRAEDLLLNERQAQRVRSWVATGETGADLGVPYGTSAHPWVKGLWVEPSTREGTYVLAWAPAEVLALSMREARDYTSPSRWTRRLLHDLTVCLVGERPDRTQRAEREAWEAHGDKLWAALMPRTFKMVQRGVPAQAARLLMDAFDEEKVNSFQLYFNRGHDRCYPAREPGWEEDLGEAFAILGRRGFVGTGPTEQPRGVSGLELLCDRAFQSGYLRQRVQPEPAWYTYDKNHATGRPVRRYFRALTEPDRTPQVRTTLDISLQRFLRRLLEEVRTEHDPAVAQAIVVEVGSGDVLAVGSVDAYELSGFVPTLHAFTPGSTVKTLVMAAALDAGVVRPGDLFDTHDGHYRVPDSRRVIREARGAPTGTISASEAIYRSCNSVMVQIGTKVPDARMHDVFARLGYGRAPGAQLGPERTGHVPELPWKHAYSHASVCFGHELSTTLWQHAAALATLVRGGTYKPLRLLESVRTEDREVPLPAPGADVEVFSPEACRQVRAMMIQGARHPDGTGYDAVEGIDERITVGTKTGTAEKVGSELCTHAELEHAMKHRFDERGRPVLGHGKCRHLIDPSPRHRSSCYTSSMCAFGRLPGSDQEVMVLVVVDEPRGGKKYGGDVAGPTAVALLREALGLTRDGLAPVLPTADGYARTEHTEENPHDEPWLVEVGG